MHGPKRFFFYSVYESDRTGAPIAFLNRSLGSIDSYAAAIGRWLVTRDGFDLLVHYLPDYDYASHALGPDAAHEALARADDSIAALLDAAGGPDEFLERYAVVLCSDHGQSLVKETARLEVPGGLVTASNRAGMVYGDDPRRLAEALDGEPAVDVALFLEDGEVVARRDGVDDPRILDSLPERTCARGRGRAPQPERRRGDPLRRARATSSRTSAADTTSAAAATARLPAADSEVPMLTVGIGPPPASITGIKGLMLGTSVSSGGREPPDAVAAPSWIERQLARRGIDDARVLAAMRARPARALRPGATSRRRLRRQRPSRCRSARRSRSRTWWRSPARRSGSRAERVLDVGTGSGYAAAVLAELAAEVHTIERIPELAESAQGDARAAGYERVHVHVGRRLAGAARAGAVRRDRRRRRGRRAAAGALGPAPRGRAHRVPLETGRRAQHLCVLERTTAGAAARRLGAGPVRSPRPRRSLTKPAGAAASLVV